MPIRYKRTETDRKRAIRCGSLFSGQYSLLICFFFAGQFIILDIFRNLHTVCVYLSSMCSFNWTKRKLLYNLYDILWFSFLVLSLPSSQSFECTCLLFIYRHPTNSIVLGVDAKKWTNNQIYKNEKWQQQNINTKLNIRKICRNIPCWYVCLCLCIA